MGHGLGRPNAFACYTQDYTLSPSSGPLYPVGFAPPALTPSKSPSTAASPDLKIKDARQSEFHEEQSIALTRFITGIGVSVRKLEISTRRARGFARPLARRLVRSWRGLPVFRRLPRLDDQLAHLPRSDVRLQSHAGVAGAGGLLES